MSLILICVWIFILCCLLYLMVAIINFFFRFPKNFIKNQISEKNSSIHSTLELPNNIDTIVIGSGISGLSAASALARSG